MEPSLHAQHKLLDLNALWIGERIGALEILCLLSGAARGHKVRLFGYRRYDEVPEAIEQVDAREILPEAGIIRHGRTGSPSLFSNRFRYELIRRGFGAWTDADMLFLKPVRTGNGTVFAALEEGTDEIATGFLAYDPDSAFAREVCDWAFRDEMIPPWLKPGEKAWFHARKLVGLRPRVADLPWGSIGPFLFTYLARKHGLIRHSSPWQRFNPVPHKEKALPFLADGNAERFITPDTEAVHLWHQGLKGGMDGRNGFQKRVLLFEENSFIWKVAKELDLTTSVVWRV